MPTVFLLQIIIFLLSPFFYVSYLMNIPKHLFTRPPTETEQQVACNVFVDGVTEETDNPDKSQNPCWWLSSGGQFTIEDGMGSTIQGALPRSSIWHTSY